jgi:nitrogen fixation NifU-like protein
MKEENPFFGRMNDPTGAAWTRGGCGEEIEVYLYIRDRVIEDARYYTEGCGSVIAAGRAVAERASGSSIEEALQISPGAVMEQLKMAQEDRHCAILAVITLYRAIADYLLKP